MIQIFQEQQTLKSQETFSRREGELIQKKLHGKHIKFNMGQNINIHEVISDYKVTFEAESLLFAYLNCEEAFYIKAEELRHPLIFYYGHTLTMYINKFVENGLHVQRLNQRFQTMFAIGVDEMDWDDLNETHYDWPTIAQVRQYRQKSNLIILKVLESLQNKKISVNSPIWDILMCIEHHKIHIQTSSAIIRRVPIKMIKIVPELKQCPLRELSTSNVPKNQLISVGSYNFQWKFTRDNAKMYLFDNQMGKANSHITEFKISKFQVSNGEFLEFINQGGYNKPELWSQEGKAWLISKKRQHPIYWQVNEQVQLGNPEIQKDYKLRTMSEIIEMPFNWPVQVNNLEAEAFCAWKSSKEEKKYQLPTQQQFFAVRDQNIPCIYEDAQFDGNFDRKHWFSPCPVDYFKTNDVYSIVGNTWEHTRTPFHAFSDFKAQSNFEDYSAPYFDEKHGMLFGGSFASGKKDVLITRNWFRHHFYNSIGFRYTISQNQVHKYTLQGQENLFEHDQQISEGVSTHYFSKDSYILKVFDFLQKHQYLGIKKQRILLQGVNVGRFALQFGLQFKQVYAIDYSARYFKIATKLLQKGQIYESVTKKTTLQELGLKQIKNRQNVHFVLSNPQNPDFKKLQNFNVVFIDGKGLKQKRLKQVLKCANKLKSKLCDTKLIVLSSKQNGNQMTKQIIRKLNKQNIKMLDKFSIQCQTQIEIYVFQL